MAQCAECGAYVNEGIKFCTECGNAMDTGDNADAEAKPRGSQTAEPHPVSPSYYKPAPSPARAEMPAAADKTRAVMSTAGFFGWTLLFGIPVLGWLICLISAFTGGNLNRRNYSRALIIFFLIGLAFSILFYLAFNWVFGLLFNDIMGTTNDVLGNVGDMIKLFNSFK